MIASPGKTPNPPSRRGSGQRPRRAILLTLTILAVASAGAAQADAKVLFDGAEVSDFAGVEAAPGAVADVPDPLGGGESVIEMTVHDQDVYPITPTENPRAQLLSPGIIRPGEDIWLSTKFLVPHGYPPVHGWVSLVSIYGAPFAGASPWQIGIRGRHLTWERGERQNWDEPWRETLRRGKWVTLLTHERFATHGWVEMWIDGHHIKFFGPTSYNPDGHRAVYRLKMATVNASNDAGPNYAKIMQYRERDMFEVGSIYFGPLKLATDRSDAELRS